MAKYYVVCDDDCRYEGMTSEQILTAIQQALEQGYVSDPDAAVISKLREIKAGGAAQVWIGTEAEFNALDPAPEYALSFVRVGADGKLYLCSDGSPVTVVDTVEPEGEDAVSGKAVTEYAATIEHTHTLESIGIYKAASVEEMNALTGMKAGDLCIIPAGV